MKIRGSARRLNALSYFSKRRFDSSYIHGRTTPLDYITTEPQAGRTEARVAKRQIPARLYTNFGIDKRDLPTYENETRPNSLTSPCEFSASARGPAGSCIFQRLLPSEGRRLVSTTHSQRNHRATHRTPHATSVLARRAARCRTLA